MAWLALGGGLAFGQSHEGDLAILTAALYLEHEAIAAYQAGAESGLLSPELMTVALAFQSDHKYHRDGITGVIRSLGGEPIEAQSKYHFGRLKTADDVLKLARRLEEGAATAYSTLASSIENKTVLNFAAHVLVDEVRHLTVLRNALARPNY
jgi:rubrerythrin